MKNRHSVVVSGILMVFLALLLSGCAHEYELHTVSEENWFEDMYRSALTSRSLSEPSLRYLRRHDLVRDWHRDQDGLIAELDSRIVPGADRELLFVLAELAHVQGKRHHSPEQQKRYYLSAVLYSYAYLFDPAFGEPPSPYEHRFRMAHDLYNLSLAKFVKIEQQRIGPPDDPSLPGVLEYFRSPWQKALHFSALSLERLGDAPARDTTRLSLVRGSMEIRNLNNDLDWAPDDFDACYLAYEFEVEGFYNQNRTAGLGVPLVLVRTPPRQRGDQDRFMSPLQQTYAATLILRPEGSLTDRAPDDPRYGVTLELYDPLETHDIAINRQSVPLEIDLTTPSAYMLAVDPPPLEGLTGLFDVAAWADYQGLYMIEPYDPRKIPVVFVHGLMSSPLTWLQVFNELLSDPSLRERYQFWFFLYPTGNAIITSGSLLRESLTETREVFDPEHDDEAFDHMVIVGHSMGGLLTKMMVEESGDALWRLASDRPLDAYNLAPEDRDFIERQMFFHPLPFVERVVFIAVPHRGSSKAQGRISEFAAQMIRLPASLVKNSYHFMYDLIREGALSRDQLPKRLPNGLDTLKPGNPILTTLCELPIDPRVPYHSIIGNHLAADTPGGTDTVVTYESAHLEGAASEKIIQSTHSVQRHPLAILELQRILRLHLETVDRDNALHAAAGG